MVGSLAAFVVAWFSCTHEAIRTPVYGAGYARYAGPDLFSAGIGILLLLTGIWIFIRLFRIRTFINADEGISS